MTKFSAAAIAAFAGIASARQCQNLTIPVELSARNGNFPGQEVTETDIEVTNFILNLSQQGNNYTEQVLDGYNTISGSYDLAATYCQPDNGPANVLQVLTHGIGFDRSYWDVPFNYPNYSVSLLLVFVHNVYFLTSHTVRRRRCRQPGLLHLRLGPSGYWHVQPR